MADDKKIPDGFAACKSGVLVKRDLALSTTTQDSQFAWQLRGTEKADTRGEDRADATYERLIEQIETSRKRDPILFRGVDYYDKLSLGNGLSVVAVDDSADAEAILDAALAFWRANNLDDLQHRIAVELATTGNVFPWLPPFAELKRSKEAVTIPTVELIPSAQVWRIATRDGRPWYYRRKWTQYEYKEPVTEKKSGRVPAISTPKILYRDLMAEDVVHTAINRAAAELRGVSSLEPSIYWSALYGRTLETVWAHALAKSILALHISAGDATPEQIKQLRDDFESSILVTRTDPRGMSYKSLATGQAFVTGGGMKVDVLDSKTTAGSSDAELRRMLLMSAVGMGLPEFALSDGDSANLASSYSQSDPFFRLMQSFQTSIVLCIQGILRIAFDRYMQAGLFPARKGKEHPIESLKIIAPRLLEPDINLLGPVMVQLVNAGIWSKQYACERMGIDWSEIKTQIETEKAEGHGPVSVQPATFPFSAEVNPAPDSDPGEETRTETAELVSRARAKLTKRMREYKDALLASDGSRTEMIGAYREFKQQAFTDLQDLMQKANTMGRESVNAAS